MRLRRSRASRFRVQGSSIRIALPLEELRPMHVLNTCSRVAFSPISFNASQSDFQTGFCYHRARGALVNIWIPNIFTRVAKAVIHRLRKNFAREQTGTQHRFKQAKAFLIFSYSKARKPKSKGAWCATITESRMKESKAGKDGLQPSARPPPFRW